MSLWSTWQTACMHVLVARLLAYPRFFYKWLMVSIIFGQIHTMHNCGIQCKLHCCDLIKLLTNMRITLDKMPDTGEKIIEGTKIVCHSWINYQEKSHFLYWVPNRDSNIALRMWDHFSHKFMNERCIHHLVQLKIGEYIMVPHKIKKIYMIINSVLLYLVKESVGGLTRI
jgi:hypothetical protein